MKILVIGLDGAAPELFLDDERLAKGFGQLVSIHYGRRADR